MIPVPDDLSNLGGDLDSWRTELTDVQVRCLHLVARGYTSKEIAKELGLTPMTVDQYLHRAKKTVGAPDRRSAARRVLDPPDAIVFKPFEFKTAAVAQPSPDVTPLALPGKGDLENSAAQQWQVHLGFPLLGGSRSDLDATQKTRVILRIAGLSLIYTIAFALVLGGSLKVFG